MTNKKQTTIITEIDDLEDIEFELTPEPKVQQGVVPVPKKHYVNNKELQEEFVKYHQMKQEWIAAGKEGRPPLTRKIGQAILDIAHRRSYSNKFIGYTNEWKEEMVGDAIEICCRYAHNYDPIKYNNPFAYITTMVTHAIINRIKIEKRQQYVKYKVFDVKGGYAAYEDGEGEINSEMDMDKINYSEALEYIADYEEKLEASKKKKEEPLGLLEFVE